MNLNKINYLYALILFLLFFLDGVHRLFVEINMNLNLS